MPCNSRKIGQLVLLLSLILVASCEAKDRRAGFWLSGELVESPVTDWSFTDEIPDILVETRTWYGIPHSVTTACIAHNGTLYIPYYYWPSLAAV